MVGVVGGVDPVGESGAVFRAGDLPGAGGLRRDRCLCEFAHVGELEGCLSDVPDERFRPGALSGAHVLSPFGRVRCMTDWLFASFQRDPAGWIAVLLALLLSAFFWRSLLRFFKALGRGLWRLLKFLASLRVTTANRIKRPPQIPLPPARWAIRPKKDERGAFILANVAQDTEAHHVILHSLSDDAQILSNAAWESIPGDRMVTFKMSLRDGAGWLGVGFAVEWTDMRGERQFSSWTERWG